MSNVETTRLRINGKAKMLKQDMLAQRVYVVANMRRRYAIDLLMLKQASPENRCKSSR